MPGGIRHRFWVSIPGEVVMLPEVSRRLRLVLVLLLSVGYVAWHGHSTVAFAKGGDGGGGDDDDDDGDKDQPPVTAGGLFTIKTYPVRELSRPLTMTQKMTQVRVGVGTD